MDGVNHLGNPCFSDCDERNDNVLSQLEVTVIFTARTC